MSSPCSFIWTIPAFSPAVLPAVFFHEIGHCISAWMYGGRILSLRMSLSGLCLDTTPFSSPLPEAVCAAAGPVCGLLWAALCSRFPGEWWAQCRNISLYFSVCNLLPAQPLDGRTDPLCTLRRPQGRSDRFGVYRGNMSCCGNAHAPLGSCTSGGMHSCRTAQSITARRFSIARRSSRDTCTCDTERIRAQSLCVRPWKKRRLITCCSFSGRRSIAVRSATLSSTRSSCP